jgi:non-heme chloroperoxidase
MASADAPEGNSMTDTAASTVALWEQAEIARANATGLTPVVFVHGLWLLSSSWQRWRDLFEANGYTTVAPGWPDDPATVEEARAHPEVFAHKRVQGITDHYLDAITQLDKKPAVIGHSCSTASDLITEVRVAGPGQSRQLRQVDRADL